LDDENKTEEKDQNTKRKNLRMLQMKWKWREKEIMSVDEMKEIIIFARFLPNSPSK
jgi:hypothetical protein